MRSECPVSDQFPQWLKDIAPTLTEVDPEFVSSIGTLMGAASRLEDALDARVRILIAMALDLASGSTEGTKNMSLTARGFGASEAQITDVVKLCCATAALQRVAVGAAALSEAGGTEPSTAVGRFAARLDGTDPDFKAAAERVVASAFAAAPDGAADGDDGHLAPKHRRLIALALEAAFGSEARVEAAARKCREAGAGDDEILSVLKIAFVNATLLRLAAGQAAYDFDL
jgi:alkylhydroperoxidase/carboxymuconolactone decarboxylase family protein YurZ